jgi:hypothetical protein
MGKRGKAILLSVERTQRRGETESVVIRIISDIALESRSSPEHGSTADVVSRHCEALNVHRT